MAGDKTKRPTVSEQDVEEMCEELRLSAEEGYPWVPAREWAVSDRKLREIASQSKGRIVGGQKGYALTAELPPDEALEAARWLRSQAEKMIHRARWIEAVVRAHQNPRGLF